MENMMSMQETQRILEAYWEEHDPRYVAEDAIFTMQPTGEEIRGREAIAKHLAGFYHGALEAKAVRTNAIFSDGEGALEARVQGRHTGVFAGIPATGREVDVPLCVTYEVRDGLIQRARIYMLVNVLIKQITTT
jgi:steroid delta-isomerase-like uncharacterized protein